MLKSQNIFSSNPYENFWIKSIEINIKIERKEERQTEKEREENRPILLTSKLMIST